MDAETIKAVGELVQTAAHAHGLTGPIQFRILREPGTAATEPLNTDTEEQNNDE